MTARTVRPRTLVRGLLAAALAALVTAGALSGGAPVARADDASGARLLLVLDASGSMNGPDPSGTSKLVAAQKALTSVVGSLPASAAVGLRVYGATVDSPSPTPASCADSQLVAPVAPLDRAALDAAIGRFTAKGDTPISYALQQGLRDLGSSGRRHLVLVSDGEENCVSDPCPVVRSLVGSGVDVQVDTVGFGVTAKARAQLQCLADAGRGTYYDARDYGQLSVTLGKLSQRALRPFTVSGTPVSAAADATAAPTLVAGQYVDSFTSGAAPRSYRLTRAPGSTVRFSVTARPGARARLDTETLVAVATTPTGAQCARGATARYDPGGDRLEAVVAALVVPGPQGASDRDPCHTASDLLVSVQRQQGADGAVPVEVLYLEEPAVRDAAALPPPLDADAPARVAPASATSPRVVGGGSFSDALTLAPGSWTDTVLPGEQLFYRVRVEDGQRATFTVDAPTPGTTLSLGRSSFVQLAVSAYAPDRTRLEPHGGEPRERGALGPTTSTLLLGESLPEVRYRNRDAAASNALSFLTVRHTALAGYYTFTLGRSSAGSEPDTALPLDVRVRVAVEGTPTGAPAYVDAGSSTAPSGGPTSAGSAGPTSTPAGPAVAAADDRTGPSGPGAAVLVLVGVLVLAAGGAALLVRRRRRPAQPGGGSQV